jgi:uncharacterized protein YjiS (DUF1127 family)
MQRTLTFLLFAPASPDRWIGPKIRTFALWYNRARSRCALAALDARELEDVGLTRADQIRECAKRFWQG